MNYPEPSKMVEPVLAEDAETEQKKEYIAETIDFAPLDAAHVSNNREPLPTE